MIITEIGDFSYFDFTDKIPAYVGMSLIHLSIESAK